MKQLIFVFLGGGLGTVLRFLISKMVPYHGNGFPWNTFYANLTGCFIIGIISGYLIRTQTGNQSDIILFATVGICGGFTTFSTFASENLNFLKSGDYTTFTVYTFSSIIFGIIMVYAGILLDKHLP